MYSYTQFRVDQNLLGRKNVWLACVLRRIKRGRLFKPNPLYTYIINIYDLVWLGFMVYQPL